MQCMKRMVLTLANVRDSFSPNGMENNQLEILEWKLVKHHHHSSLGNMIYHLERKQSVTKHFFLRNSSIRTYFRHHHTDADQCVGSKNDMMFL